jgi:hypothetical protein
LRCIRDSGGQQSEKDKAAQSDFHNLLHVDVKSFVSRDLPKSLQEKSPARITFRMKLLAALGHFGKRKPTKQLRIRRPFAALGEALFRKQLFLKLCSAGSALFPDSAPAEIGIPFVENQTSLSGFSTFGSR